MSTAKLLEMIEALPAGFWPEPFAMTRDGLFFQPAARGDGGAPARLWLSGPFDVAYSLRTADGGPPDPGVLLRFVDGDGVSQEAIVLKTELQGDAADVRRRLAELGLAISTRRTAREHFNEGLNSVVAPARAWHTHSSGWKLNGRRFVTPGAPIGGDGDEPVFYLGRTDGAHYSVSGSAADWRARIAARCIGNPVLMFCICAALSGVLLKPVGAEGGGVHFVGPSSIGKSTGLWGAASVWGRGGPNGFASTWRATGNGLEGIAAARNHTLLALDEISRCDPDDLAKAFYGLSDGQGKERMRADGSMRRRAEWQCSILSTGETSFESALLEGRRKSPIRAGQEVRILSLPIGRGADLGVIEELHGAQSAARFAEEFRRATMETYGHAGRAFVEALIANPALIEDALERSEAFIARATLATDTGQVRRACWKFALPAVAGELATELGILPWPKGAARNAAILLFESWAATFGRSEEREARAAVDHVRHCLEQYGNTAFWRLTRQDDDVDAGTEPGGSRSGEGRAITQLGYRWKDSTEGELFLIPRSTLAKNVSPGRDPTSVARALHDAGFLVCNDVGRAGKKRYRYRVRVNGLRMDFYAVSARILGDVDDEPMEEAPAAQFGHE